MPTRDTLQFLLKPQPLHLSLLSHRLVLTCKGMQGGAPDVAGCHPSAGSGHCASRGQGAQDVLQQIGLSCPWAVGRVRVGCCSLPP